MIIQPLNSQVLVPTVDTVRYAALLDLCVSASRPALLCGGAGVGKSAIAAATLRALAADPAGASDNGAQPAWGGATTGGCGVRVAAHTRVLSAQTVSVDVQGMFEAKLERKRRNRCA